MIVGNSNEPKIKTLNKNLENMKKEKSIQVKHTNVCNYIIK